MSIKYYSLAKDEEPPEEFCAIRDMGGEPSEYAFYVPESEVDKLRELAARMARALNITSMCYDPDWCESGCAAEFKCRVPEDGGETSCPTWARLVELGVVK